ncbi:hypothetical protein LEP1GSC043_2275 [Leptospira weilii str. Ecochallenge]|uniref:Uncharacterized protein n=1 Tax=Leptospira weilii str. Ecochallenge TaxID=1049986 RepID=N1U7P7_9LEPT|nr:hypothetical protein LEP1GSC051_3531 [Leptospira sp. P2653]EMN43568.1 hypothetical protein LEP1GSC086_0524 [Leptospira weilii str. LNT 1234]EMY16533.1 hypothetical protein LEP1GSC043_2275 [Leptospira weilii str. Ecochallenge]
MDQIFFNGFARPMRPTSCNCRREIKRHGFRTRSCIFYNPEFSDFRSCKNKNRKERVLVQIRTIPQ